jgi:hypothetical protein
VEDEPVRTLVISVRVGPFGERHRAIVSRGAGLAGEPVALVVRDDPHAAVREALEQARYDVADELTRR